MNNLNLIWELAKSGLIQRYEGSYLGILWYLLKPLGLFGVLYLVFSQKIGSSIEYYPLFLLIGIILYNTFQNISSYGTLALLANRKLIKSLYFPRQVFLISYTLQMFISHVVEVIVLIVIFIFMGLPIIVFLFYPLFIVLFFLFSCGVGLIIAFLSVYFTDINHAWSFVTKILLFATPIFYELPKDELLFLVNLFNPLYYYITASRDIFLYHQIPETFILIGCVLFSLFCYVLPIKLYQKFNHKIGELL